MTNRSVGKAKQENSKSGTDGKDTGRNRSQRGVGKISMGAARFGIKNINECSLRIVGMTSFSALSLVMAVCHAGAGGLLISRNAKTLARWNIPIYRAVLWQFSIAVVALAASFVLAVAIAILGGFSDAEFLGLGVALFFGACAFGQGPLIGRLASLERKKLLNVWTVRRIGHLTALTILGAYSFVSLAGFGTWRLMEKTAQEADMWVAQEFMVKVPSAETRSD